MATTTTRDRIVDSSRELFLARGFHGTGVATICKTAGVSKGSFYHLFESKEDLGVAVLDAWFRNGLVVFAGFEGDGGTIAFLKRVETLSEQLWEKGCLLAGFATELSETHPDLRDRVAVQFSTFAKGLAHHFRDAARPEGPTALELSELFLAVLEGGIVLARADGDVSRISSMIRVFRQTLELSQVEVSA